MSRPNVTPLIGTLLAATVGIAGCVPPPGYENAPPANTPEQRLAILIIRLDAGPVPPGDIVTAFGTQGDPTIDTAPDAACPVRSMVLNNDVRHARGTTGGLCGTPLSGDWSPLFGGPMVHDPATLDIGYTVPLADAWRSGAATWSDWDLAMFASDQFWERVVIVPSSDTARGDRAPDTWQPAQPAQCIYATAWINAKWAWHLTVTHPEHDALAAMISTCPGG